MPARILTTLAALCITLSLPVAPVAGADPVPPVVPGTTAAPDFDGDGRADVAFVTDGPDGDVLRVHYGSGTTVDLVRFPMDHILTADLNADGYTDLVEVPYSQTGPGTIDLVFGSASGLDPDSEYTIYPSDVDSGFGAVAFIDTPAPRLVASLRTEGFEGDELSVYDLGADGRPVGEPHFLSTGDGLPKLSAWSGFGEVMAATGNLLVVGAPRARVGRHRNAGAVVVVSFGESGATRARLVTQNTRGVGGRARTGDRFGSSLAALDGYVAVGTPHDRVGRVKATGSVQLLRASGDRLVPVSRISQASHGVPGGSERGDRFGASVALGTICDGVLGVVVGGPGEALARHHSSDGAVWVVPTRRTSTCPARMLAEGRGLDGAPTSHRGLGGNVATTRDRGAGVDDVVIGAAGAGGLLLAWSPQSLTTVWSIDQHTYAIAGR